MVGRIHATVGLRTGKDWRELFRRAYALFPRYRLDEAIRVEVEKLTGLESHSLEEARKQLLEAVVGPVFP